MGWVDEKAWWFVLPAFDEVFIGCESLQCFESLCEDVGLQEVVQMFSELLVIFIIGAVDGCLFSCSVHAFDLTICPRMIWFCQAVLGLIFEADASKDMREGIPICFAVGELDAPVGEDRMAFIGHGRAQVA